MYFAFQVTDAIQCDVLMIAWHSHPRLSLFLRDKGSHVENQVVKAEYFLVICFVFDVLNSDNTILHF